MSMLVNVRSSERPVLIPTDGSTLPGTLGWPTHPSGVVLFAHGSGSGRLSPRNQHVARHLHAAGMATLLFDLLTESEALERDNVFNIPLLAGRLLAGMRWVMSQPETATLPVGLFGASTGGAAALMAAALESDTIGAVVSRGGRPDLAADVLAKVRAPTLLVVGGADHVVLALNREAAARLSCAKRIVVIPGATHLFEEPGTLDQVAEWAAEWFVQHLAMPRRWDAAAH